MKDMKESLNSTRKPDITHCRRSIMVYIARAAEYGVAKGYGRANYLRATEDEHHPGPGDWERFRAYLRAALSHLQATLDEMEHHQADDLHLTDIEGMLESAYAADEDATPEFPASGLPHVAHLAASVMMAIEQAVAFGLLPEDPGQPWAKEAAYRKGIVDEFASRPPGMVSGVALKSDTDRFHGIDRREHCTTFVRDRDETCKSCGRPGEAHPPLSPDKKCHRETCTNPRRFFYDPAYDKPPGPPDPPPAPKHRPVG
jgi:hypothetical protein